jgi:multiple sugar transport system permease protein
MLTGDQVKGTQGVEQAQLTTSVRVRPASPMKQLRLDLVGIAFTLPFLIIYALFVLWPIFSGLATSLTNAELTGGATKFIGFENYQALFHDSEFWNSMWHTVEFALLSTPPLVVLSLAFALLANREIPGRWLFRLVFFAPYVLPVSVVGLIWVWLYEPDFGVINGYLSDLHLGTVNWLSDPNVAMIAVVLTTVWWTLGFNFVLYLAGLQEISPELYEAAAIDGAGPWAKLTRITIPLLKRTTMLIIILQVLASLKVFGQIYVMTNGGPGSSTRSVVQYIYEQGFASFYSGYASAISYIFFVFVLVVSILQFAFFSQRVNV